MTQIAATMSAEKMGSDPKPKVTLSVTFGLGSDPFFFGFATGREFK